MPKDVSAADFLISGEANGWGTTAMHPFSCRVSAIGSEGVDWYLVPADFPEKYFYVKKMAVQREKYPELGFVLEDPENAEGLFPQSKAGNSIASPL